MKFSKLCFALLMCAAALSGCDQTGSSTTSSSKSSSSTTSSSSDSNLHIPNLEGKEEEQMIPITSLELEINETYDLYSYLKKSPFAEPMEGYSFEMENETKAMMTTNEFSDYILTGIAEGETNLYIFKGDYYQKIALKVYPVGGMSTKFTFNDYGRLSNKKVTIFGDSISYGIGTTKTYWQMLQEKYNYDVVSYAVGGTTMTYMYSGSNIAKEYLRDYGSRFNGVSFVVDNEERVKVSDYIIILYGHNDLYFQPIIGTTEYLPARLEDCNSFKSSYAYALNFIKSVNPSAKILLLGPNYSEYTPNSSYDIGNTYFDYIEAILDMANYYNVKFLDLWQATATAHQTKNVLAADHVHSNIYGHEVIATTIENMK